MLNKPGASVSLYNLAMYNSTFNISSKFGNNLMWITWLSSSLSITIPDGYYVYSDISNLIEYYLIQNNWYWVSNNIAVYAISCSENSSRYAGQINISVIPSSSQSSGLTKPSGATWSWPSSPTTPQVQFCPGLGKIFGFNKNYYYPPVVQSTAYSYLSDSCPIVSPVYSYILTCSLLNTNISTNINNVLSQIPLNNSFGGLITLGNLIPQPISIYPSPYSSITIKFLDQNLNPLNLVDPEITLILVLEY
jgi:hypothetical protein